MSERKAFLLRIDPKLLGAVQRWANDDLRSLNAQIEFLLRRAVRESGRAAAEPPAAAGADSTSDTGSDPEPRR
jgi:hypothetical protein